MLIYGPCEQFDPGRYRVVISGESKHWTGEEWLDVTCDVGKRKLSHSELGTKSLGAWQITQEFKLEELALDLEIRLWVSDLTNIKVQNLTLVKNEGE